MNKDTLIYLTVSKTKNFETFFLGPDLLNGNSEGADCYLELREHGKLLEGDSRISFSDSQLILDVAGLSKKMIDNDSSFVKEKGRPLSITKKDNEVIIDFGVDVYYANKSKSNIACIMGSPINILTGINSLVNSKNIKVFNSDNHWLIKDGGDENIDILKKQLNESEKIKALHVNSITAFVFKNLQDKPQENLSKESVEESVEDEEDKTFFDEGGDLSFSLEEGNSEDDFLSGDSEEFEEDPEEELQEELKEELKGELKPVGKQEKKSALSNTEIGKKISKIIDRLVYIDKLTLSSANNSNAVVISYLDDILSILEDKRADEEDLAYTILLMKNQLLEGKIRELI